MTCVLWHGNRNARGYGRIHFKGTWRLAHRVIYAAHHSISLEDLGGQVVRHTCDNPPCVNPEHLLVGTQQDNIADMVTRGRTGARNRGIQRCKHGHEFTSANTYIPPDGKRRICRKCAIDRKRKFRSKRCAQV